MTLKTNNIRTPDWAHYLSTVLKTRENYRAPQTLARTCMVSVRSITDGCNEFVCVDHKFFGPIVIFRWIDSVTKYSVWLIDYE